LGAHWYAKGLYIKEEKRGSEIRATTLFEVKEGDFVYNRLFAWKGAFAVATTEVDSCFVSNEFPCFTVRTDLVEPKFLWLYFSRESAWNEALGLSSGSTPTSRNRLREPQFLNMEVLLPPLDEQRRIVSRIEEFAAKIEEARELRHGTQGKTDSIFQLHREKTLQDYVGHGPTVTLDEATILICGFAWSSGGFSQLPIGLPVIRIQNLGDNPSPSLVHWSGPYDERFTVQQGDLLLSLSGSFKAEYWKGPKALLNQRILKCEPRPSYDKRFLFHVLQNLLAHIVSQTTQTSVKNVSMKVIRKLRFPACPLTEQRRIVAHLDDLQAKVGALKKLQSETAAELGALMPSILSRAFRGEL